jgi:hypothetical protein
METQNKHITQTERKLESLSALVLILKKGEFSLLHPTRSSLEHILNICIYTKFVTTQNGRTSYNI